MDLKCIPNPPSLGRVLSSEEFEEFIQFAPDASHELTFRLIFESAFRPHELLSLRVSDIERKGNNPNTIVLVRIPDENPVTPSRRNKMGKRSVVVHMNANPLIKHADERRQAEGTDALLFPYPHKHFSQVFSRMKKFHAEVFSAQDYETIHNGVNDMNTDSVSKNSNEFMQIKEGASDIFSQLNLYFLSCVASL